ncbi:MAG: hypothetical protein QN141_07715 [Armatimonadota bacterium]|nr:hypothetical protein [Armatimonadota bacterium]MDR7450255.1 hypothetical protein [Armatimonadota bacterium]MDR7467162.1 hypothetical protein [Armatimonadota bacterium]MDR7493296.1 hypothetical protein [Armatimonadota bacterium]MDR7500145.1 hypothetical protein [Armatimonadota bacterium]
MSRSIREVRARYEAELMALPGVVSVGVGGGPDGTLVIVVGLDRPRPETVSRLPRTLEGYTVQAQVVGRIEAR